MATLVVVASVVLAVLYTLTTILLLRDVITLKTPDDLVRVPAWRLWSELAGVFTLAVFCGVIGGTFTHYAVLIRYAGLHVPLFLLMGYFIALPGIWADLIKRIKSFRALKIIFTLFGVLAALFAVWAWMVLVAVIRG